MTQNPVQNLWILTIGSSDVQLLPDHDWAERYAAIDPNIPYVHELGFEPTEVKQVIFSQNGEGDDDIVTYRAPSRVLGMAYSNHPNSNEISQHLCFPLLDNFIHQLVHKENVTPDKVVILLTDQDEYFSRSHKQRDACPYWQDTNELKPILKVYIKKNLGIDLDDSEDWIILRPQDSKGLDNWDYVLGLVGSKLRDKFKNINLAENSTVYVSHQAGTPAISSAVQFLSLSQFGGRVEFLVSSEQDKTLTDTVKGGRYLRGIEIQQIKKLIQRYDYAGIQEVLKRQIKEADERKDNPKPEDGKLKHIAYLLNVAIHWNCANFNSFSKELKKHPDPEFVKVVEERTKIIGSATKTQNKKQNVHYHYYWWTAYEAAYLGIIRLNQNNTVEAMFHSFRAVEGLLSEWINKHYKHLIKDGKIHLPRPIKVKKRKGEEEITIAESYGKGLYYALDSIKDISKEDNLDIWIFGNCTFGHRNSLFHGLEGLAGKKEVFRKWQPDNDEKRWGDNDEEKWKTRVRNCLNFIAKDDLPNVFESLEEASLMSKVHAELKSAIENL